MVKWGIICLVGLIAAFALYVRLAPSDPARWHKAPPDLPVGDSAGLNSFVAVRGGDREILERLIQIAEANPRTERLAGSADEGMITLISRSRLWGFPDYTTIRLEGQTLTVYGRARFGQGDMGVNRARVEGWLAAAGIPAP
ncbi:MAG: DUF1499 domain-containing protein [Rhodobacteraceae bacterium]|jgi:hypothetical protein|nr:DUF1499 domain-containing protein [Paracoccaceae bacterium]